MASQHHPPFDGATNVTATINDESAPESHRLKVLNWNVNSDEVDGGSPLRFKAIISEIEASGADAILLQEVALNFKKMLQQQLGHVYDFKDCSADSKESFFVMIMLRKCRMAALSCKRIDFQGGGRSNMGRHVLSVETQLAGWDTSVVLMTAHLESCKENSEIRMLQYEQLLRLIVKAPATCVQICGGDFNLREAEDKKARKRLKDSGVDVELAVDTFDAAGRPFEASCTWRRKMDKTAGAKSIQARFDRQMFRSGDADFSLVVEDGVSLLGLQDVSGIDGETACRAGFTTPSDHMGILCQYAYALGGGSKVSTPVASGLLLSSERCTESPIVLVLIGAPGSGKTTLAAHLSSVFARISQDALGSRSKCEEAAKSELESGRSIVIDRCNFDARQRSTWISIARNFAARAIAVQLEVPLSICSHRVAARRGHEGGVEGDSQAAKDIVTKLHGDQQPVADDEGFDHVRVFRHMSTPENSAMELLTEFGMQPKNRSLSSKITLSCPTPLPYRVTSASRAIGAQIDSSDSESSQERRAIALSLSSEHVSAPTPASAPAHVVASSVHKACASDDDCILVQHEPPRGHVVVSCCNCESLFLPVLCRKRPLPGMLAAAAQPVKVKRDPDAASAHDLDSVQQAPPAKKGRAKPLKTPAAPAPAQNQHQQQAAKVPTPPPPVPVQFQFTADTLLKAATLYLATHPFLHPQQALSTSGNQHSQHAPLQNFVQSQPHVSHISSRLSSQQQLEDSALRVRNPQSYVSSACSSQIATPQRERFDFESMFSQAPDVSVSSSAVPSERVQAVTRGQPLLSGGNVNTASLEDLTDVTSEDFDKNFMSLLLPPPRSKVAAVVATPRPTAPACDGGAVAGTRWNYQSSATSLKDIADKLCTSTPRHE